MKNSNTRIPKIIHQTWKESKLPFPFDELSLTWKKLHPDWEYKLWTDDMLREFIRVNFPDFLGKYDGYERHIQRVDAFRYFLLLKEGGVYVDMDFECLRNITSLLNNKKIVIGKEPPLHSDYFSMEMILCNAFMACEANNDFMRFVCDEMISLPLKKNINSLDVLESTGPFLLTNSFYKYKNKQDVAVLEASALYPLTRSETREIVRDNITEDMQQRLNKAYALHYFWGGW